MSMTIANKVIKLSDIKSNPDNPRLIKDEAYKKLVQSIKNFPEMREAREIVVNKDMVILGGNMRFRAMQEAGVKEAPVKIVDWSEEKQKEFIIKDNVESGEWDWDKIANEWEKDKLAEWGMDVQKWVEDEVVEDETPEVIEEEQVSKLGEIYQLGRHRIMCGDSADAEAVAILMNGKKADMVFTSPPYNAGDSEKLSGNTHTTDNKYQDGYNDKQTPNEWKSLVLSSLLTVQPFSKYQFYNLQQLAGNKVALIEFLYETKDNFVDVAIWNKQNTAPAMAKNVMNSQFEYIFIFTNNNNPTRSISIADFRGTVSNVYNGNPQRDNQFSDIHAATFPISFPAHFINTFTKQGTIILDNFCGSGTTLIACEQTNRTCYGMEIDPKYADVIRKRYAKFVYPERWEKEWEILTPKIYERP